MPPAQTIHLPRSEDCSPDATIVRWHKAPGESFGPAEVLAELVAPRATILLRAGQAGRLVRWLVETGRTVPAGGALAEFVPAGGTGENSASAESIASSSATSDREKTMSTPKGTVIPILMPQAGNTMEEGTVVKWHVSEGDTIRAGQVIFEIETDKATMEVEASDAGRLARIVVREGQSIAVRRPVAYLAEDDADVEAYLARQAAESPASTEPAPTAKPAAAPPTDPRQSVAAPPAAPAAVSSAGQAAGRVKASPAARRLAMQRGVNLAALSPGSGPGGRILSTDIPAATATGPATVRPAPASSGPIGERTRVKMSPMRRAIARNLLASKQNIPHFYMETTVEATAMMNYYRAAKSRYPCSVNDVVVLACGRTLAEFPRFRSRLEGEELVTFPTANIGIAVGMDDGLVVPVVVAADRMNLQQVGAETRRLAEAARGGKIEGLGQGVFTISNLGMFGIARFSAIINPPEAAILAVGAVREDVIVQDGAIRPTRVMTLTLSCDHRVIDGLEAAKFLSRLKELLENPLSMD